MALVGAFLLIGAGPAAAAPELRLSPDSGPPGTRFTITGTGFAPALVEIRWESRSGPLLATTAGPDFTVDAEVPDAPPNSHSVVAVITDGGSVSTSSTSFQVTGSEPVETPATTPTTVAEAPVDTTPPSRGATEPEPSGSDSRSALGGGSGAVRTDAVGGGVDGGMAETTNGGEAGGDGGGSRAAGAAGSTAGAEGAATTTTAAAGAPAGAPVEGSAPLPPGVADVGAPGSPAGDRTGAPRQGGGEASGSALPSRPTSQSSGAVRNPLLLVVGLALVFAAGVVLAVRNRHRAVAPPIDPGT